MARSNCPSMNWTFVYGSLLTCLILAAHHNDPHMIIKGNDKLKRENKFIGKKVMRERGNWK